MSSLSLGWYCRTSHLMKWRSWLSHWLRWEESSFQTEFCWSQASRISIGPSHATWLLISSSVSLRAWPFSLLRVRCLIWSSESTLTRETTVKLTTSPSVLMLTDQRTCSPLLPQRKLPSPHLTSHPRQPATSLKDLLGISTSSKTVICSRPLTSPTIPQM